MCHRQEISAGENRALLAGLPMHTETGRTLGKNSSSINSLRTLATVRHRADRCAIRILSLPGTSRHRSLDERELRVDFGKPSFEKPSSPTRLRPETPFSSAREVSPRRKGTRLVAAAITTALTGRAGAVTNFCSIKLRWGQLNNSRPGIDTPASGLSRLVPKFAHSAPSHSQTSDFANLRVAATRT